MGRIVHIEYDAERYYILIPRMSLFTIQVLDLNG